MGGRPGGRNHTHSRAPRCECGGGWNRRLWLGAGVEPRVSRGRRHSLGDRPCFRESRSSSAPTVFVSSLRRAKHGAVEKKQPRPRPPKPTHDAWYVLCFTPRLAASAGRVNALPERAVRPCFLSTRREHMRAPPHHPTPPTSPPPFRLEGRPTYVMHSCGGRSPGTRADRGEWHALPAETAERAPQRPFSLCGALSLPPRLRLPRAPVRRRGAVTAAGDWVGSRDGEREKRGGRPMRPLLPKPPP